MSIEQIGNIASMVETFAVIVSLIFIGLQIRQNNKLAKATNVQSLVNLSSPFNLLLAQDRQLTQIWQNGSTQFEKMDDIDKARYMFLIYHSMTLQEHIYYQWENNLIAEPNYESWKQSFEDLIQKHNIWVHWDSIKDFYKGNFAKYLKTLIDSSRPQMSETNSKTLPGEIMG